MTRLISGLSLTLLGLNAGLAFAHVLEMPNKWRLSPEAWLTVQQDLYDGWGTWIPAIELIAAALLCVLAWKSAGRPRWLLLGAVVSLIIAETLIWPIWVMPTNSAVDAWSGTTPMEDWQTLRLNWEGGHFSRFVVLTTGMFLAAFGVGSISNKS